MIDQFLEVVGQEGRDVINKRIQENSDVYTDEYLKANKDEYFTIFSDAIANGDIKFNETVFTKIKDVIRRLFQDVGLSKVDFETGQGVYNFLKDYNKSIHQGALSKGIKRSAKSDASVEAAKLSLSRKVDDSRINSDFKSRLDQFTGPAEQRNTLAMLNLKNSQDFAKCCLSTRRRSRCTKKTEKEFIKV